MYDYLIVGAGLYGATAARELTDAGKRVLVVERRPHIAGNAYTKQTEGINVHVYGAHIFHTNLPEVWKYVNRFAEFNRFTNSPVANYRGELYSLPFNMHTFHRMWGVVTPQEAEAIIARQRQEITGEPRNLEEQAISLVGRDIYEKLIRGYTEKQWGRPCDQLPAFIIRRIPVRMTFDSNYFDALYQGIPKGGYTGMAARMLEGIEVQTGEVHSSDVFYGGPNAESWQSLRERTSVDCVEMESFALFHNANVLGKRAACLLTISDSFINHVELSAEERQNSFRTMMTLALESAIKL